jgi:hypothetical protein
MVERFVVGAQGKRRKWVSCRVFVSESAEMRCKRNPELYGHFWERKLTRIWFDKGKSVW